MTSVTKYSPSLLSTAHSPADEWNVSSRVIMQNLAELLPKSRAGFLIRAAAFLHFSEPSRTHAPGLPSFPSTQPTSIKSGLNTRPHRGPRIRFLPRERVREITVSSHNHVMCRIVPRGMREREMCSVRGSLEEG